MFKSHHINLYFSRKNLKYLIFIVLQVLHIIWHFTASAFRLLWIQCFLCDEHHRHWRQDHQARAPTALVRTVHGAATWTSTDPGWHQVCHGSAGWESKGLLELLELVTESQKFKLNTIEFVKTEILLLNLYCSRILSPSSSYGNDREKIIFSKF